MKPFTLITCMVISLSSYANNIKISNVTFATQDKNNDYYMIEFDLSWENSWRTSTYETNWDAAWVFIKFTPKNIQNWQHASLHYVNGVNDGHVAPTGGIINTANNSYGNANTGIGVFIYRDSDGIGNINFNQVQLRWDYGLDGVGDDDVIEISVHAIEMVYVPQGAFQVGDGMGDFGQFEAGNTGNPFTISSEGALTLGGTNVNNLSNNDALNQQFADDFNYATTQSLPADFPKGYHAFYCMKYEVSQEQYAAFLSHLTQTQRSDRTEVIYINNINVYPIATGNHYATPDFPSRAMDYTNWADVAAYLDWAGLRPMSELEYEKATRGVNDPVPEEYAWGNDTWYLEGIYTLQNEGTEDEIIVSGIGENVGNANSVSIYQGWERPLRCGIFAASAINKTREETGASYWGIMELTGNCYERVISVGESQARDFSGFHGNGSLQASGNASFFLLTDWAFVSSIGAGFRNSEISQRYLINTWDADRNRSYGIRGIRTAP
ncbi:MAG: SUMF1/EgtB/PvdO family nonheme iron enzyme [Saprospiraceae bacterium]|nr:SUMF1/EgtB/PvdO family nonheme iron enzyme [Saprospiraceae bacterium]